MIFMRNQHGAIAMRLDKLGIRVSHNAWGNEKPNRACAFIAVMATYQDSSWQEISLFWNTNSFSQLLQVS
jgi:hypothetical protein